MRPNLKETAALVTFPEEPLNEKLYFLYSVVITRYWMNQLCSYPILSGDST